MGIGLSPNGVTLLALGFGMTASLLFVVLKNVMLFASLMLLGAFLDALDGEVARRSGKVTRFGGYLDAMCDRFYETAVILAVAHVTGHWALSSLFLALSYSVSYSKARVALEVPVSNDGWPDLMGREGRSLGFFLAVLLWGLFPETRVAGVDLFVCVLAPVTAAVAVTLIQRLRLARELILNGSAAPRTPAPPVAERLARE